MCGGWHALVLADVDESGLEATRSLLPPGIGVLPVRCDVSQAEQVDALAQATYDRFGARDLLFNNAGVGAGGRGMGTDPRRLEVGAGRYKGAIETRMRDILEERSPTNTAPKSPPGPAK